MMIDFSADSLYIAAVTGSAGECVAGRLILCSRVPKLRVDSGDVRSGSGRGGAAAGRTGAELCVARQGRPAHRGH